MQPADPKHIVVEIFASLIKIFLSLQEEEAGFLQQYWLQDTSLFLEGVAGMLQEKFNMLLQVGLLELCDQYGLYWHSLVHHE